jgi:hypothetical protein
MHETVLPTLSLVHATLLNVTSAAAGSLAALENTKFAVLAADGLRCTGARLHDHAIASANTRLERNLGDGEAARPEPLPEQLRFDQGVEYLLARCADGAKGSGRTCLGRSSLSPFGSWPFQERGEIIQSLLPEAPVAVDPLRRFTQGTGAKPADAPLCVDAPLDQAGTLQHPQMARHRRQRDIERLGESADRRFTPRESRQDRASRRIGERSEGLV